MRGFGDGLIQFAKTEASTGYTEGFQTLLFSTEE